MWFILLVVLIKAQLSATEPIKLLDATPSKILRMFPWSYSMVIHYENSTSYIINTLFMQGFKSIVYFINYDIFYGFTRPNTVFFINVVVLDNQELFLNYSWKNYNVEQQDTVFFVEGSAMKSSLKLLPIWKDLRKTVFWPNVFVYILDERKLYYYCYCCGEKSGIQQTISLEELPALIKSLRTCHNFNGVVFKVAYASYKPFFWCKNGFNGKCDPDGIEGKLLKLESQQYNFKFSLTRFSGKNRWKTMLEKVDKGIFDFALGGISVTKERTSYADWSSFISAEDYVIVFAVKFNSLESLKKIISPFSYELWAALLTTLLVMHLFLCRYAPRLISSRKKAHVLALQEVVVRSIFEQQSHLFRPTKIIFCFLMALWFFFIICMTSAYKGVLISTLVKPDTHVPTTLTQLLTEGYTFQMSKVDWTILKYYLQHSEDPEHAQVLARANDDLEFCDSIQKALHENVAVIDEKDYLEYTLFENCVKNLTDDQVLQLRIIKEPLYFKYHSIPFKKRSLLAKPNWYHINNLKASGIMTQWWKDILRLKLSEVRQVDNGHAALKLSSVWSVLVCYLVGNLLAICVFLWEILTYKCR